MGNFTKEELVQISNVFMSLKFSPGQSNAMTVAENIIKKCSPEVKQEDKKE